MAKTNSKFVELNLYITFFLYLFSIHTPLLASFYILGPLLIIIGQNSKIDSKKELVIALIVIFNILLIPIEGISWREMGFLCWTTLCILLFDSSPLKPNLFIRFVNTTYILFLILSIFVSLHFILPGFKSNRVELNQFDAADLIGYNFQTLVGFDGSTAGIDTYSILVFALNFAFNKNKTGRLIMISIPLLASLATLRLTPLLSLLLAVGVSFIRRKWYLNLTRIIVMIFVPFFILSPLIYGEFNSTLFSITHGRSSIWYLYLTKFLKDCNTNPDLLFFGYRQHQLPLIQVSEWQSAFSNPHSSYLRLFLSWGIVMFVVYFIYLFKLYFKTYDRKVIFIDSIILFGAITNEGILFNRNPVFIFMLLYFAYSYHKQLVKL